MKRFLILALAFIMIALPLASCGDDKPAPIPGTDTIDQPGDDANAPDTQAPDTQPEDENQEYEPLPDAKYSGMLGIEVVSGGAYFNGFKVVNLQNKKTLVQPDFAEGDLPEFTYANEGAWNIEADPIADKPEKAVNVLSCTSVEMSESAVFGNPEWNYIQYALKVLPEDEDSVIAIRFCAKDENNYFELVIGETANFLTCYEVKNGEKTALAPDVYYVLPTDAYTAVGITVNPETIAIYVGGSQRFNLFDPEYTYSSSIALFAEVDAPFCSSWETAGAINDGLYPDQTYVSSGTHYGSWANEGTYTDTFETLRYNWDHEYTIDSIGIFFWHDTASRSVWLSGGGINSPASYTVQYLNDDGEYVDVTGGEGYEVLDDVMNITTFDAVTTTSIQLTLYKFTDDEAATITDPSTRGCGIYEFEVYEAK